MKALSASLSVSVMLAMLVAAISGCGKSSSSGVALSSSAFSGTTAQMSPYNPLRLLEMLMPDAYAGGISTFSFCVTEFRVIAPDGSDVKNPDAGAEGESDDGLFQAKLGLINLGSGASPQTWGTLNIPDGTTVKGIHIELHKDPQLCQGAQYSVSVNGQTLTKDLEFKFTYPSSKVLHTGDAVQVSMNKLATAFTAAIAANAFNDSSISQYFDPSDPTKSDEDSAN